MEYFIAQVVAIIFGIVFIYLTYLNVKRNEMNTFESYMWYLLWIGMVLASIFLNKVSYFANEILNFSRTLDFFIIIAFLAIFGIVFYIFIVTKKTQNKVEALVRNLALKEKKK